MSGYGDDRGYDRGYDRRGDDRGYDRSYDRDDRRGIFLNILFWEIER